MTTEKFLSTNDVTGRYIHNSKGDQIDLVKLIDKRTSFLNHINPKKYTSPQQLMDYILEHLK